MEQMRADRFLTALGYGSRSEAKKIIRDGRLLKNGLPVKRPEERIAPETDRVELDGAAVRFEPMEYWVLNKPAGILCATEDRYRETVISYMGLKRRGMVPCGRLDLDTEGLLLVTDDGQLVHRLLAPGRHVDKRYEVSYSGELPPDAAERFDQGIILEDGTRCMPAELEEPGNPAILRIQEGKFHQVKRMFRALGTTVTHLKRLSMGPLYLDSLNLRDGEFRRLTESEVQMLREFTEGKREETGSRKMNTPGAGNGTESCEPELPDINRFRAFLFDFDGTLVDSMWMWGAIDEAYLRRFGITDFSAENLSSKIVGMSLPECAEYFRKEFHIPAEPAEMIRDWEEMTVEKYRREVPLKPGARHFLDVIKGRGEKTAITSSNSPRMIRAAADSLGISEKIDLIITADEVASGKPDPAIYIEAAKRLGVAPEDCLVFEDIPEGILAGKRAGMTVVAVKDDFSAGQEAEKKALAGYMIGSYEELL